jgi:hypothetical protein
MSAPISPSYGVGADQFTDEDMLLARRVVTAGAEVLDHYHQHLLDEVGYKNQDARQWWVGKIDWAVFDIVQEHWCILGQLFGSYCKGIETLVSSHPIETGVRVHLDEETTIALVEVNTCWAIANGFFTCIADDEAIPYGALEIAWLEVRNDAVG